MVGSTIPLGLRDWGAGELLAGLGAALGLMGQVQMEGALTDWFSREFRRPAFVVNSGRRALQLALTCLHAEHPDRNQVLLPALACPALTDTVLASGLLPAYADIGNDLNTPLACLGAGLHSRTLAIVMVHAYGHPADSAGVASLCRDAGVALIDDAAQRVDPSSGLGTAGDFGIFSFAQSKSVVAGIDGSGGVLLVNAPRRLPGVAACHSRLPVARGRVLPWLEFLAMPHSARLAYYAGRLDAAIGPVATDPARIGRLNAAIANRQLATLPQRLAKRRRQLAMYRHHLEQVGLTAPQLFAVDGTPGYLARLLVRLPAAARQVCRDSLQSAGISTRLPYPLPDGVTMASHPIAARATLELLELPLPATLTEADVQRVTEILARCGVPNQTPFINSNRSCSTTGN